MDTIRRVLKRLALNFFQAHEFDFRSLQDRLNDLQVRHGEISAVLSADDDPIVASERLLILLSQIVIRTRQIKSAIPPNRQNIPEWINVWPGEHYRLLAAIVEE